MPGPRVKDTTPLAPGAVEDVTTFLRMDLPVEALLKMARDSRPTPTSGDALKIYAG